MELHLNKPSGLSFSELTHSLPDNEFQNLTRSTVPSLAFWKHYVPNMTRVCDKLGIIYDKNADLCFEYSVPSYSNNKPSYTDLMYLSKDDAISIEAKYTEPRYENISSWLGSTPTQNKQSVLLHWLNILQPYCNTKLKPEIASDLIYQMLHRVASGCFAGGEHGVKISTLYQVFSGENSHYEDYAKDLSTFRETLGLKSEVKLALLRIDTKLSPAGERLASQLVYLDGEETASAIRMALFSTEVYEFGEEDVFFF